jgi:hypothetical protein
MESSNVKQLEPATKWCWKCETAKPVADFSRDKSRQDGLQPICRSCAKVARAKYLAAHPGAQKAAYAKWYAKPENRAKTSAATVAHRRARADALIEKYKSAPCMDCRNTFPSCCMDFDHRPEAEKLFGLNFNNLSHRPLEDILAEIAKCDLVCSNCHRIRTKARNQTGRKG